MSGFEIFGVWVAIALTLMLLSFLYDDNPIYKIAEHLFLGVSIGVAVTEKYYGVLRKNLVDKLSEVVTEQMLVNLVYLIPLVLSILLFAKLSKKHAWLARIPIAILVAAYAGVKMTGEANGNLLRQVARTMPDLRRVFAVNLPAGTESTIAVFRSGSWADEIVVGTCLDGGSAIINGFWCWSNDGAGILSSLLLVGGLVCCLLYFTFTFEQRGPLKGMARTGVWFLMIGFGASFGFTVMGRIALAIGRFEELLGRNLTAEQAAQVHPLLVTLVCTAAIIAFLVVWEKRRTTDRGDIEGQAVDTRDQ